MKKKIVLKVCICCNKCRTKALTIAASAEGEVELVAIQGVDQNELVVTGERIDASCLAKTLRKKVGWTDIVTVEEVKEEKIKEEEKKVVKKEIKVADLCPCNKNPYCMQCPPMAIYTVDYDPQPLICSIM